MGNYYESALNNAKTKFDNVTWRGAKTDGVLNATGATLPGQKELAVEPEHSILATITELFVGEEGRHEKKEVAEITSYPSVEKYTKKEELQGRGI